MNHSTLSGAQRPGRFATMVAFGAVYLIWGSTFLAIRYVVSSIPPFMTAAIRALVAGSLLLAWAASRGYRVRKSELTSSMILASLFFLFGHGLLHLGEQTVTSNIAALIAASQPFWVTVLRSATGHELPLRVTQKAGLLIGVAGVAILCFKAGPSGPNSRAGMAILMISALLWSCGVVYSGKTANLPKDNVARAGLAMSCGGLLLTLASIARGEPHSFYGQTIAPIAWKSLVYLVIFGSLIAFTAYSWLITHFPAPTVATYTYVNPVIAVILGSCIAHEPISRATVCSALFVVTALILINFGNRPLLSATTFSASRARNHQ